MRPSMPESPHAHHPVARRVVGDRGDHRGHDRSARRSGGAGADRAVGGGGGRADPGRNAPERGPGAGPRGHGRAPARPQRLHHLRGRARARGRAALGRAGRPQELRGTAARGAHRREGQYPRGRPAQLGGDARAPGLRAHPQRAGRREADPRGGDRARQDQHARARLRHHQQQRGVRSRAQCLRRLAHRGRLLGRHRQCHRRADGPGRARLRHRRLGTRPRRAQRHQRAPTDPGALLAGGHHAHRPHPRHRGTDGARGRRPGAARHHHHRRPRQGGPGPAERPPGGRSPRGVLEESRPGDRAAGDRGPRSAAG